MRDSSRSCSRISKLWLWKRATVVRYKGTMESTRTQSLNILRGGEKEGVVLHSLRESLCLMTRALIVCSVHQRSTSKGCAPDLLQNFTAMLPGSEQTCGLIKSCVPDASSSKVFLVVISRRTKVHVHDMTYYAREPAQGDTHCHMTKSFGKRGWTISPCAFPFVINAHIINVRSPAPWVNHRRNSVGFCRVGLIH